ncbi:hypothetical protein [Mycolicibacter algericus]|uniref:hypothetical protein n=1 Tax=Mycolicibacter algericus TaxID=1288388 RepID=UPI003C76F45B
MIDIRFLGTAAAAILAWAASILGLAAPPANANPDNGCYSPLPWAVCNQPWNNYPPGSWSFNPGPRQWGPHGYVPCTAANGCDS